MKKIILLALLFLCVSSFNSFSQKIEIRTISFGYEFSQESKPLNGKEVKSLLEINPYALKLFSSGRTMKTVGLILGISGVALLGYGIGSLLAGIGAESSISKRNALTDAYIFRPESLISTGAGLTGAYIGLSVFGSKKIRKSILLYNDLVEKKSQNQPNLNLSFSLN